MTTTPTHERPTTPATEAYLAAVGAALEGVPDSDRQELLDDLAEHLREMAPENDADLIQRLGTPEQYAAELLASAGIELSAGTPFARLRLAERTRRMTALFNSSNGRAARAFWRELRPGWWVIRAWLILAALAIRGRSVEEALWIPKLTQNDLQDFGLLVGAIALSIWIGRGPAGEIGRRRRWATYVATAIGIVATLCVLQADRAYQSNDYTGYPPDNTGSLVGPSGSHITNVFAYDASGKSLGPVFLFDQDGAPLDVGNGMELQNAGVPFVSGLFPQPVFETDQYGNTRAVQPTTPVIAVPRLPQLPNINQPAKPAGGPATTPTTSPTTAKRGAHANLPLPVTTSPVTSRAPQLAN